MTSKTFAAVLALPGVPNGIKRTLALAALIVVAADWLFYDRPFGISFVLFLGFFALCVAVANQQPVHIRTRLLATGILAASLLPGLLQASPLPVLSGLAGIAVYTLMMVGGFAGHAVERLLRIAWLLAGGPFRFCADMATLHAAIRRLDVPLTDRVNPVAWLVPIGLGAIFLLLFRAANPVIEGWLGAVDLAWLIQAIDMKRILFWVLIAGLTWSFLRPRPRLRWMSREVTPLECDGPAQAGTWLGTVAVRRSLILFNVLFAVQSCLDVAYLWGGVALPEGMTYAEYAQRGAYPLIFTALLAGAFVLIVLRPGSVREREPLLRGLVYLWIGQTVLLVISSLLRLNLYVEVYSLTYLRVAAFIWMLLVAAGLILIVARIALGRSNMWLIGMNVGTLIAMLYVCAFLNFPQLVAAYNIAHRDAVTQSGGVLDTDYICGLGAFAYPAVMEGLADGNAVPTLDRMRLETCMKQQVRQHLARTADWRAWSVRGWRLWRLWPNGQI